MKDWWSVGWGHLGHWYLLPRARTFAPKGKPSDTGTSENDIWGSVPRGHMVTSGWTLAHLTALDLGFTESEAPGGWGPIMQPICVCFSPEMI